MIVSTVVAGILILAPRKMGSAVQWTAARKIHKNFSTQVEMSLRDSCLMTMATFVNRTNLAPYLDCKKSGGWLLFCLCKDNSLKVRQKRFYITQHDDPPSLFRGWREENACSLNPSFPFTHSAFHLFKVRPAFAEETREKKERGVGSGDAPARSNFAFLPWLLSCEVVGGFAVVRCCVRLA